MVVYGQINYLHRGTQPFADFSVAVTYTSGLNYTNDFEEFVPYALILIITIINVSVGKGPHVKITTCETEDRR